MCTHKVAQRDADESTDDERRGERDEIRRPTRQQDGRGDDREDADLARRNTSGRNADGEAVTMLDQRERAL